MDENNKNLLTALLLSILVVMFWSFYFAGPKADKERAKHQAQEKSAPIGQTPSINGQSNTPKPQLGAQDPSINPMSIFKGRAGLVKEGPRVAINNDFVSGSIYLKGARLDDLVLTKYKQTLKSDKKVELLSPEGAALSYYNEYGWVASENNVKLPGKSTIWSLTSGTNLSPSSPIELSWDNGEGLIFKRHISIDDHYMFSVKQEVVNKSQKEITLYPYALIMRRNTPPGSYLYISHEGLVGMNEEEGLTEISYGDAIDLKEQKQKGTNGWIAIADKYWATAIIPPQGQTYQARYSGSKQNGNEYYQTDYLLGGQKLSPGKSIQTISHLFAGPKESDLLDDYQDKLKIYKLELLIDWGWFYFITKPIHSALKFIHSYVGNFGVAILILTVLIKLLFYPLANKSYASMSKMKKMQPEMEKIRTRFADDKMRQQKALMDMYKKEKINPMSGCWPVLIQIPVFFALYKVLYVTLDMRHAPFFGWIQDLSAPDPTSIFNLFGLLPFQVPEVLHLGIWPILMGLTMFIQMRLNPTPTDPIQQKIFTWMPIIFTVMLKGFAAGLVIYWAWNNILSIIQQYSIMRRMGVEVDLLGNMGIKKKKETKA